MIQLTTAAHCLAMLRSAMRSKAKLRTYGHKVSAYSARDITSWAHCLPRRHQGELIPDALAQRRAMILSGRWANARPKAVQKTPRN